jgi:hypothetical protein
MPTVFCSIKLSKLAGLKTRLPSLSMDNWNGHLFALQGRKCLVFVHKETFYSFVIFDILKRQLTDFKQLFTDNFIKQLEHDNLLADDLAHSITKDFQNLEFSTTDGDNSTIGYLNDCIVRLKWERDGRAPTINETKIYVENYYNENPLMSRKGITPKELMREKLKSYGQE